MNFARDWFDVLFLLFFLGVYLFIAIFKGPKVTLRFLFLCILWATSAIWIVIIPGQGYLFSDSTPFPGVIVPLGGLIYGVPLTAITFITWLIKRKGAKKSAGA